MKRITAIFLTTAALGLSGAVLADDKGQDDPGFLGRVWQGTKNILGVPTNKDEREDKNKSAKQDKDDKKNKNDKKENKTSKQSHDDDEKVADILGRLFGDDEKRILRDYYGSEPAKKQKPLPPGLKKKVARGGELPPGWQKKMARGEVLPEDVYRYGQRLPDDVWRKLPRQPDGTSIIQIEGKAARIIDATRTIVDVFDL